MRPSSYNLPRVGLVLARQVIFEIALQVLEHVHLLATGAHHTQALREHGPILGCQFGPLLLVSIGDRRPIMTLRGSS